MAPIIPIISAIGTVASVAGSLGGGGRQQYQYPQQVAQAPPPAPVVVAPQKVLPSFTMDQANAASQTAAASTTNFYNAELEALQKRAQEQNVTSSAIAATTKEGQEWLDSDIKDRSTLLQLNAQVSQNAADYSNLVNKQNFQTQLQAMQQYPNTRPQVVNAVPLQQNSQSGGVGDLLGAVLGKSTIGAGPGANAYTDPNSAYYVDPNSFTGQQVYANPTGVIMPPVDYTSATMNSVSATPDTFGLFGGGD